MAYNFKKANKCRSYTVQEIISQIADLKKHYMDVNYTFKKQRFIVSIQLKPTENSMTYNVKYVIDVGSTIVNVFVDGLNKFNCNDLRIPHLYSNGSLCLYYPKDHEWDYHDLWSETLIPWTSLWLYFFEIWLVTGEWIGGGIHAGKST